MPNIKIKSADNEVFDIDIRIAKCWRTIKTMLECGMDCDKDAVVPLPNVSSAILRKVLIWSIHHKEDPQPTAGDDKNKKLHSDDIPSWDASFLKTLKQSTLFELMMAANYLDIKDLLDVTSKTVANMINDQPNAEQIRKTFHIVNDFTAREEKQIKENIKLMSLNDNCK